MQLTGKTLSDRFSRYKTAYIKARNWRDGTGAGTDENGDQIDLTLINEILEEKCPCFGEMDAIFTDKPNVVAFGILDSGVENSQQDLPGEWILQILSPSDLSQHPTKITHVSDSAPGSYHTSGDDSDNSDGLRSNLSFAKKSSCDNRSAHNSYDDDYTCPKTLQESFSGLQHVIKSFKDQEEQEDHDFCPLKPSIEPPADYNAFIENKDEENKEIGEIGENQTKNEDDKENKPMDIDEMEVKRLLNEDVEEAFIPRELAVDSNELEILVPPKKKTQPSQQASQKRGGKPNALTPSK
ncbi:hypothetical protein DFH28DRAFT_875172, partial [Melampsora americana]